MAESGARRVMRSLHMDQNSVAFLTEEDKSALRRFAVLRPYLDAKKADIERWNAGLKERGEDKVKQRELTNLGTISDYVQAYLEHQPGVRQDMTLLVRQLQPTTGELPIDIYCFTTTTARAELAAIQPTR